MKSTITASLFFIISSALSDSNLLTSSPSHPNHQHQPHHQQDATPRDGNVYTSSFSEPISTGYVPASSYAPSTLNTVFSSSPSRNTAQPSSSYSSPSTSSSSSSSSFSRRLPQQQPVAIIKSAYNAPTSSDGAWDYSFESENGIKQQAEGSLRTVGDAQVMVMRGSYSYTGPDGQNYVVDWFADESGFHPSAAHLPQPVEIPFADQAEAVAEQIRFAQQEDENRVDDDTSGPALDEGGASSLPSYQRSTPL